MPENERLVELFTFDAANPAGPHLIFPVGKYVRKGKEFEITDEKCAEFARNFASNVLGRDVATNIEHIAEEGAVGWIKAVIHKAGEGLYATIDWTERGLKLLAEQSFRYFSPEVIWNGYEAKDGRKYNHVIEGLAVTNYPYFGSQTAMFSEKAAKGAEVWMDNDKSALERFMYDAPMMGGEGHNLLGMLESVSFILKCLEKADEPDDDMIERVTAVKDALKEAVRYIVDEYADAEPTEEYATKREQGVDWESSAFLVVPDSDLPSGWKLRIKEVVDGKKQVTKAQLGRAAAALGKGFRGNRVQLSAEDRASAVRKLKAEYRKLGVKDDEMPKFSDTRSWLARLLGNVSAEPEIEQTVEDTMADKQQNDVKVTPTTPTSEPTPAPAPVTPTPEPTVTAEQFATLETKLGKMVGDLQNALTAANAKAERFQEQFATEQTARRQQQFADEAREKYSAVPGKADETGALLMWAFDSDTTPNKDHYARFTGILAAHNAAMADMFRERGYVQSKPLDESFEGKIAAKQQVLQTANPKLTVAEAYSEALKTVQVEDPEGAARWVAKRRGE